MSDDMILITGVRVSFPHLFTRPVINGEEGKCGATLMLDPKKDAKHIHTLEKAIEDLRHQKFKNKKLPSDKLCLRDGEDKGRPEYEGYQVLSTNCKGKPIVIGRDGKSVVTSEDESEIYAGCYVNAKVRLWAQDNQFGKRINAELVAIQFLGDGDPLDGSYVSVDDAMDGFEGVGDADGEDDFLAA